MVVLEMDISSLLRTNFDETLNAGIEGERIQMASR
jgi:hypothetical protein